MIANRPGIERHRLYASTTDTFDGDLDFIAIEYAMNGEPAKLTREERRYAARLLDERGIPQGEIAQRLGITRHTVADWKANNWQDGPVKAPASTWVPPQCGEPRMYRQHLKRGERCEECRAANAAADRRYRLTGRRSASASSEQ